jgi:hypothetical protein
MLGHCQLEWRQSAGNQRRDLGPRLVGSSETTRRGSCLGEEQPGKQPSGPLAKFFLAFNVVKPVGSYPE